MSEKENKNLQILIDSFLERFEPATDFTQADETMTSTEIQIMFLSTATIDKDELFDSLSKKGFKLKASPADNSFVWLLKERS